MNVRRIDLIVAVAVVIVLLFLLGYSRAQEINLGIAETGGILGRLWTAENIAVREGTT